MKNFLLFFSLFLTIHLAAQSNDTQNSALWDIMNTRKDHLVLNAIGTQYHFETWQDFNLITFGGKSAKLTNANINLVSKNVEIQINDELNEIPEVRIAKLEHYVDGQLSSTFYPLREFPQLNNKKGVYEHIKAGDQVVLINHYIVTVKPDPNARIVGAETRVKLLKRDKLYVMNKNEYVEIGKPKDLSKIIGSSNFKKLEKIADENKLDLKNNQHFITALKMLGSQT